MSCGVAEIRNTDHTGHKYKQNCNVFTPPRKIFTICIISMFYTHLRQKKSVRQDIPVPKMVFQELSPHHRHEFQCQIFDRSVATGTAATVAFFRKSIQQMLQQEDCRVKILLRLRRCGMEGESVPVADLPPSAVAPRGSLFCGSGKRLNWIDNKVNSFIGRLIAV